MLSKAICGCSSLLLFRPPQSVRTTSTVISWTEWCELLLCKDCMPAPFRVGPDGVRMFVQGRWIAVPSNKIQYRTLIGDRGETGGDTGAGGR